MKNFLAGLGAGVGLGLLLAPRSGRETRNDLSRGARRAVETVREKSGELAEALPDPQSILQAGREQLRGTAQKLQEGAASAREQVGAAAGEDENLINTVEREQLIAVYGIGPVLADRIIENRPYRSARELVERGIIPESTFAELKRELPNMRRSA